MAEGKMIGADTVQFAHPVLDGFACPVQHPDSVGKPVARDLGSIGVAVLTLPTGQPRLMVVTKHSDGTSLASILNNQLGLTLIDCLRDALATAEGIAEIADRDPRQ